MVWYLTSDQVLVHYRNSKTTKKDDDNSRDNPDYDICIDKIQHIENEDNNSSKPNQILCSICKRSDKIVN